MKSQNQDFSDQLSNEFLKKQLHLNVPLFAKEGIARTAKNCK